MGIIRVEVQPVEADRMEEMAAMETQNWVEVVMDRHPQVPALPAFHMTLTVPVRMPV